MTKPVEAGPLPLSGSRWTLEAAKIPERGIELDLSADAQERAALVAALDLVALASFTLRGRVAPMSRGRFRLEALIEADPVQRCVVTLESVAAEVSERIEIELWPAEAIAAPGRQIDLDPEAEDPEPFEDGRLDIGRLAYETLSLALPPFPRSATAGETGSADRSEAAAGGPFASLARLKPRQG